MRDNLNAAEYKSKEMMQFLDSFQHTKIDQIGMTPHQVMYGHVYYGEKKDVFEFRAFGCRAWVYTDKQHRKKGKRTPRAKEAVYVGFATNTSAWEFWALISGSLKKEESWRQTKLTDMNSLSGRGGWWGNSCQTIPLTFCSNKLPMLNGSITTKLHKLHVGSYSKAYYDKMSDVIVRKVGSQENIIMLVY